MQARLAVGIALWAALPAAAGAADWPGFRGLRHGVSDERDLPRRWSATEGIAWKVSVPGAGWSSPILVDGLLLQPRDGSSDGEDKTIGWQKPWDRSYLLALDAPTGRTRYRAKRGLSRIAHVTPAVVAVKGEKQVVSPAGDVVQGFEPATGRLLWTARSEGEGVVPSVVVAGDLVVTASGFGDPALRAFRLGGSGDVTASHLAWQQKKAVPMVSSPVVAAGLVFVVKENGIASALDAATGAVVWQARLPDSYSASPVAADGRVYFLSEECETSIVAAGREWRLLGRARLPGRCQASMAVAGGRLFIRTDTELYAIGR